MNIFAKGQGAFIKVISLAIGLKSFRWLSV